jgi:hypothetical protein
MLPLELMVIAASGPVPENTKAFMPPALRNDVGTLAEMLPVFVTFMSPPLEAAAIPVWPKTSPSEMDPELTTVAVPCVAAA